MRCEIDGFVVNQSFSHGWMFTVILQEQRFKQSNLQFSGLLTWWGGARKNLLSGGIQFGKELKKELKNVWRKYWFQLDILFTINSKYAEIYGFQFAVLKISIYRFM